MTAIERFFQFIEYKGLRHTSIEKQIGLSNGYLGKMKQRKASIGSDIIENIVYNYPELNIGWLIMGQGEMLNTVQPESKPYAIPEEDLEIISEPNVPYGNSKSTGTGNDTQQFFQKQIERMQSIIESQQKQIERMQTVIESQQKQIEKLQGENESLRETSKQQTIAGVA